MRNVIAEGVRAGVFRADVDPDFGASALFGMTATVALDWLAFEPDKPLDDVLGRSPSGPQRDPALLHVAPAPPTASPVFSA